MKRIVGILLTLLMLTCLSLAEKGTFQPCHRVTVTEGKWQKQRNDAEILLWTMDTCQERVDTELNGLVQSLREEMAPSLKPGGSGKMSSRLEVSIRHSRTGLSWMSFLVMGRIEYHQQVQDVRFTTRTYDMLTGQRVRLTDVFGPESEAWAELAAAVEERVRAYFPDQAPDEEALRRAVSRESLEQMDFTLHGVSLVLHLSAEAFYPGRKQLIEVPLYYPQFRPLMTPEGQRQTDNDTYYKFVALTIDDGPNGYVTQNMLKTLMRSGERATFFLTGERIAQQTWTVQREHDEGHSIGTHFYQHLYAKETSGEVIRAMTSRDIAAHTAAYGLAPTFARAPGGHWSAMEKYQVGWPLIMWTVETADWAGDDEGPNPKSMAGNIVAGVRDGGIILMHDLKPNSPQAVAIIAQRLQEAGYMFVTVEELFARDGVELQPNHTYWQCLDGVTIDYEDM